MCWGNISILNTRWQFWAVLKNGIFTFALWSCGGFSPPSHASPFHPAHRASVRHERYVHRARSSPGTRPVVASADPSASSCPTISSDLVRLSTAPERPLRWDRRALFYHSLYCLCRKRFISIYRVTIHIKSNCISHWFLHFLQVTVCVDTV